MRRKQITQVAAVLLLLPACVSGPVRLHDGGVRPPDEVALVRRNTENRATRFSVEQIDGRTARGESWELLPGAHTIALKIRAHQVVAGGYYNVTVPCAGTFRAEAGSEYVVDARFEWNRSTSQGLFDAWVKNAGTGAYAGRIDCLGE